MNLTLACVGVSLVISAISVAITSIVEARNSMTQRPVFLAIVAVHLGVLGGGAAIASLGYCQSVMFVGQCPGEN
jgi:hypothetical protein